MKTFPLILLWGFLLSTPSLFAQLTDDFSDGDFLQNPSWQGKVTHFQVNLNGELQSAGEAASDTIYLSVPSSRLSETEWRFYLRYEFAPSTTNFIRIYLTADQEAGTAHTGYFVGVGESGNEDSFDLFRQDSNSVVKIIDGLPGKAASSIDTGIRVRRDSAGVWSLFTDSGGDGDYSLEGTVEDTTYTTTSWFGIWVKHTSTRNNAFFFDNFYIGEMATDTLVVPPAPVQPKDLIINEIYADPNPSEGLPEAEYLELFNRSNRPINLSGFTISNGTTVGVLPAKLVNPGEYIILTSAAVLGMFESYGLAVSPSGWPSLVNSGDNLGLRSPEGVLTDSVDYQLSWYRETLKQKGGYSLELINPWPADCPESANWIASVNENGGTPGTINSVFNLYPDTIAPFIRDWEIVDSFGVRLYLNELPDTEIAESPKRYRLLEGGENPLSVWILPTADTGVEMLFGKPFLPGENYHLIIDSLADCSGNLLHAEIKIILPAVVLPGDVKINELLFNPYSGGSDFVEIVNVSDKTLNLGELWVGEIFPDTDSIFNGERVSDSVRLFLPGEILCLTADASFQKNTYFPPTSAGFWEMKDFPGYDDSEGECVIFSSGGEVLDRFFYRDNYHFSTLSEVEGVSLERISLKRPSRDSSNWHSAAGTYHFATPGYANSQAVLLSEEKSNVFLEYPAFSPNGDGEKDVLPINYQFDFPGANARVTVYDTGGRKVREIQPNTLLSTQPGTFFWDGTNDRNQKMEMGMYIILFEVLNQSAGEKYEYRKVAVLTGKFQR
ncbi:MAG: lamin tail domain-containing protein [Bacteroidia bacterium]|nr:lamin tail domain-containing protein [Bacteroidia bacterium]